MCAVSFCSCNSESNSTENETTTEVIDTTVQREIPLRKEQEKIYRISGTVKSSVEGLAVEKESVNIWLTPDNKLSVYKLSAGEKVIIFNETKSGYLFLSPASDSTKSGYILKGWIDYGKN